MENMSDILIYNKKDSERFWQSWDVLARANKTGPRNATSFIKWALAIAEERGLEDDLSFALVRDGRPAVAVFLPIGVIEGASAVTLGGGYVAAPLMAERSLRKEAFAMIDEKLASVGVKRALFAIDPLAEEPFNYLQTLEFLDTSILAWTIDLTGPGNLLRQCRKGHISDIKRNIEDARFTIVLVDATHPDHAHHEAYERLHERSSGRKTRSTRTFDMQYAQLLDDESALFGLLFEGKPVAYAYFQHAGGKALYASVADDPEVKGYPLHHRLVYEAMEYYLARGMTVIDTDQPSCPSSELHYWPDEKQHGIALFKRGFVGSFRPSYRGIRYYDKKAALTDLLKFSNNYVNSLP